jgi:hypothetical protein
MLPGSVKLTGPVRRGVSGHIRNSQQVCLCWVQLLAQICLLLFQYSIERSAILFPIAHFAAIDTLGKASGGQVLRSRVAGRLATSLFSQRSAFIRTLSSQQTIVKRTRLLADANSRLECALLWRTLGVLAVRPKLQRVPLDGQSAWPDISRKI